MAGSKKKGKGNKKKGDKSKSQRSNPKTSSHQEPSDQDNVVVSVDDEKLLTEQVYQKIEMAYQEASDILLNLNYNASTAHAALLSGGNIFGEDNIITNIVRNSITYIDRYPVVDGIHVTTEFPLFDNMFDLISLWVQTLVSFAAKVYPNGTSRCQLLWRILACKSIDVEWVAKDGLPGSSSAEARKSIDDQTELDVYLKERIPSLQCISLTRKPREDKNNYSNVYDEKTSKPSGSEPPEGELEYESKIQDVMNTSTDAEIQRLSLEMEVKQLEKEIKERKEWAKKKEKAMAEEARDVYIEMNRLKIAKKQPKNDLASEQITKLLKLESGTSKVNEQIADIEEKMTKIEVENEEIRAEISACKVNGAETEKKLKQATKKEKQMIRKIEASERMIARLQEEIHEHKGMKLQLDEHLRTIKESQIEIEVRLREELKQKEIANDLRQEARRALRITKDTMEKELVSLKQAIEAEAKRAEDEINALMSELNLLIYEDSLLSSSSGVGGHVGSSVDNSGDYDCNIPIHLRCVMCLKRQAKILFLPCAHQVVCIHCAERNGDHCPSCAAHIEEKIRVYP